MGATPSTPTPSTPTPSAPSPLSAIPNALQNARETVSNLAPTGAEIKTAAMNTIHGAYDAIRGSGSIMTELGKAKDSFIGMPAEMLGGALSATGKLLTRHPIEATRTAATSLINASKDLATFVTSPFRLTVAAGENMFSGVKKATTAVAALPKKGALKAYHVVSDGVNEFLNLFGPGEASSSSSNAPSKAPDLGSDAAPPGPAPAVSSAPAV